MTSPVISDATFVSHINNNSVSSNSSFALKISGKGLYDYFKFDNIYNSNGIAFQLLSNMDDEREFAIVDTSNSNNPSLNFHFQSNQITIKSPTFINLNSNMFILNNSFVGIGTTNPLSSLHLHSSSNTTLIMTNDLPNQFTISKIGSNVNISNYDGNIGIGTTEPQGFLDIRGDVILPYSKLGIGTTNPRSNLDIIGNCLISADLNISNLILKGKILNGDGSPFLLSQWSNVYDEFNSRSNIIFNSGFVGIGTTSPQSLLDVSGRISCADISIGGSVLTKAIIDGSGKSADVISLGTLKVNYGGTGLNFLNSNQLLIGNGTSPLIQSSNLAWSNTYLDINGDVIINSNCSIGSNLTANRIGIGTTNPLSAFHVFANDIDDRTIQIGEIYLNKDANQNFNISNNYPTGKIIIGNLTINSNGFIGIGNTNPISNLDVNSNINIRGILDMNNNNISNANIINTTTLNVSNIVLENTGDFKKKDGSIFYASRWTSNSNVLSTNNIFFNSGFVGIGTTNPQVPLDVLGNVNVRGVLNLNNSNISNVNFLNATTLNISNIIVENTGILQRRDGTPFYASRWTSNSNVFTPNNIIYNLGFVGIGTTNPQVPLDVLGNVSIRGILNLNNSNISNATFINTNTLSISNIILENTGILTRADGTAIGSSPWIVSSINANNIYYSTGNIGIGTTNPNYTLDVLGDINLTGGLKFQNNNVFNVVNTFDTSPFQSQLITNNSGYINFIGNVSVGNINTNSNFFVYGNSYIRGTQYIQPFNDGNSMVFYFNSNSNITQNINNNYDINFKLNSLSFNNVLNPFLTVYNRYQTANYYNTALKLETQGSAIGTLNSATSILLDSGSTEGTGKITFNIDTAESMNLTSNGITVAKCIDIIGNSGTLTNAGGAYFNSTVEGSYFSGYNVSAVSFSLRTTDNIICGARSYALSDIRIKTDIQDIDHKIALSKIMKIEPKIYKYVDKIERGSSNVYGFIAQQIKEVIPEAVEETTGIIPNIYKLVSINEDLITLDLEDLEKLNINDIIQIITLNSKEEVKIIDINLDLKTLRINKRFKENQVFLYGKQVNDFHILDKSYIFTLNVCATQAIYKDLCKLSSNIDYLMR
jgi:hypothetical protein